MYLMDGLEREDMLVTDGKRGKIKYASKRWKARENMLVTGDKRGKIC